MNIGSETENIEFKRSTSELKAGIVSITAILNKHGKGTLYFGVRDNGDVCGQQIGTDTLRDIARNIRNSIKPECSFEINKVTSSDNKDFIEVPFSGNRQPYSAYGKYYIRFSDQDRQMTQEELEDYFMRKVQNYSDWEQDDSGVPIADMDDGLIKNEVNKGFANKRIPFEYSNTKAVLNKFGLLSKNKETVTNAGNVLFSKNKPILVKLATYATETKETFLKLDHFQGNIYECINKAMNYILEEINWKIVLDGSIKRKEEPEIPQTALREIVVNAFCHAKYDSNTAFEISVFKDRVCIYSPGFFPSGFTPDDFAIEHEEPIMLNPKIINVLFKTNEIESFGYGFENTFKICKEKNVKYYYENTKSGFRFTFYRADAPRVEELNKTDRDVLKMIEKDNYITNEEIADTIGKSTRTVFRTINKLKLLGYIEKVIENDGEYWKVLRN